MDYEELKAYMEKLSLELRNNRGNLLFISQYLSHFTKNILAGAPFRILLSREELEYYVANVATDEDELFRLKSLTP